VHDFTVCLLAGHLWSWDPEWRRDRCICCGHFNYGARFIAARTAAEPESKG
jgi:hypothetical protein